MHCVEHISQIGPPFWDPESTHPARNHTPYHLPWNQRSPMKRKQRIEAGLTLDILFDLGNDRLMCFGDVVR